MIVVPLNKRPLKTNSSLAPSMVSASVDHIPNRMDSISVYSMLHCRTMIPWSIVASCTISPVGAVS